MNQLPKVTAAGAIIYHTTAQSERLYLIIRYAAGHWDFAKGHSENNETVQQTALREIYEETALRPTFDEKFLYSFDYICNNHTKRKVYKTVHLFLAYSQTMTVFLSKEHTAYVWLAYQQACQQLTYINATQALAAAHDYNELQ